jgi:2-dehydropantoate 2-reductase
MACLFAARLSSAGYDVCMLGTWQAGLEAVQSNGVTLLDTNGQEQIFPVRATSDPCGCPEAKFALVMVKSWQTERAAQQIAPCLRPDGLALTLQNGMGNYEILVQYLGEQRAALGTTTIGAHLLAPGKVRAAGSGTIFLGAHPRIALLADVFRSPGYDVKVIPDPLVLLWSKLVINAAINPLTAVLNLPNGKLLELPEARKLMAEAAREVAAVAHVNKISLPYDDPVQAAEKVAQRTATNRSSMLQDIDRCAPTEIDAICGAVVRLGEQNGIPTPVNRMLWLLVRALAQSKNEPLR